MTNFHESYKRLSREEIEQKVDNYATIAEDFLDLPRDAMKREAILVDALKKMMKSGNWNQTSSFAGE